jgi:hypothetical protein
MVTLGFPATSEASSARGSLPVVVVVVVVGRCAQQGKQLSDSSLVHGITVA